MEKVAMASTARPAVPALEDCCPAVLSSPLTEVRAEELAGDFAVLADPARIRLLSLIASAGAGEACVCELVEPLGRSQPTVSHHLRILAEAGLIVGDKRGRWVWYRAVPERLRQLRSVLA
ncbi:MAG: metalloregulator ArsR/SmtB family transcription factor [Actinomycetota bacterium]|nr:metalloregulator ArsR/SmtB family transcription factor [Actinomycetota bacterium]